MTYRTPAEMPETEPEPEPEDRIERVHHCSLPWRWPWRFQVDDLFHCRCGKVWVCIPASAWHGLTSLRWAEKQEPTQPRPRVKRKISVPKAEDYRKRWGLPPA